MKAEKPIESYLRYLGEVRKFSPLTLRAYRRVCEQWCEFLHTAFDAQLNEAGPEHFIAYIERRAQGPGTKGKNQPGVKISARSLQRDLCILKRFYAYLVEFGPLRRSPAARLPELVCKPPEEQDWLTEEECFRLLEGLDLGDFLQLRTYVLIALLWCTGLRRHELRMLDWKEIDLQNATLKVRHGKGGKQRLLYLNDRILEDLIAYRKALPPGTGQGPVFFALSRNQNRAPRYARLSESHLNHILRERAQQVGLGIELSPHVLRHTFATHMYESGTPIAEIKEMLGHDEESETCIYVHIGPRMAKRFLQGKQRL